MSCRLDNYVIIVLELRNGWKNRITFLLSTNMHHHEGQFLEMIIVSFSEKSLDWNFWLDSLLESVSWSDCNFQNWLHPILRSSYPSDSTHQPRKVIENLEFFGNLEIFRHLPCREASCKPLGVQINQKLNYLKNQVA